MWDPTRHGVKEKIHLPEGGEVCKGGREDPGEVVVVEMHLLELRQQTYVVRDVMLERIVVERDGYEVGAHGEVGRNCSRQRVELSMVSRPSSGGTRPFRELSEKSRRCRKETFPTEGGMPPCRFMCLRLSLVTLLESEHRTPLQRHRSRDAFQVENASRSVVRRDLMSRSASLSLSETGAAEQNCEIVK